MKIYSVYYYQISNSAANVKFMGLYTDLYEAKERLQKIIPGYKKHINNTVQGIGKVGWINENKIGDFDSKLSAFQPHSAINLFF